MMNVSRPLIVILCALLLISGFGPSFPSTPLVSPGLATRSILYVGGSGPDNYTSIQQAVDNATANDTIFVYAGTYSEHILTTIPLTITGEAATTTIIDGGGSGNVVKTLANITLTRFTLQNGGIGIYIVNAPGSHITSNTIHDNWEGVGLYNSSNCEISSNSITSNGFEGIALTGTQQCSLHHNLIVDHLEGIYLIDSASNLITDNTMKDNSRGIDSNSGSTGNHIYHNNFFSSDQNNAYDEGSNTWDNGYPSGGNYWDDYNGPDNNHDGIGDTPYNIPGGAGNKDYYPFMNPVTLPPAQPIDPDPEDHATNVTLNPVLSVSVFDPDSITINVSFYDAQTHQIIGTVTAVPSGTRASLTWNNLHPQTTYQWYAVADDGTHTNQSDTWTFQTGSTNDNQPPTVPEIDGPLRGEPGMVYGYTFTSTDPEGSDVSYYIDWNDSTPGTWIGPYTSGQPIKITHQWTQKGTYHIRAKAKDTQGLESDWGTLTVKMPVSLPPQASLWHQLLDWILRILENLLRS